MTYRDLLVHVDETPQGLARLRLAANLAEMYQAYLIGLFVKEPPMPPSALAIAADAYAGPADADQSSRQLADAVERAARSCEAAFQRELERTRTKGAWRVEGSGFVPSILRHAGCVDLVIVGQANPSVAGETMHFPGEIALASGRPVLVVPHRGTFETVGERIMIAWNGGRESIRAASDALPFLKRAKFVALFEVSDQSAGPEVLEETAEHLARHGVKAERYAMAGSDREVGEALLSRAANFDCDLVVMGAYGHARLREIILGGATRTVLRAMNVPVLMSH